MARNDTNKFFYSVVGMIVVFIFCFPGAGSSAEDKKQSPKEDKKTEVVETKINLEQMVLEDKPPAVLPDLPSEDATIDEQKLIQLSASLKNAIDENKELKKDRERVLEELKDLRGQHEVDATRLNAALTEREEFKRRADSAQEEARKASQEQTQKIQSLQTASDEKVKELQAASDEKIKELQTQADRKTREWEAKLKKVEGELAQEKKWNEEIESLKGAPQNEGTFLSGTPAAQKAGLQKMLSKIQQLTQENDRLKDESAKVHYNLGNIFFKQGEYKRSAEEYQRAVKLLPYDPANHYNLALVSGEFLKDYKTALKHYQQYLFLNPNANDAMFVKEKILKARMELKSTIASPLDAKTKIDDDF